MGFFPRRSPHPNRVSRRPPAAPVCRCRVFPAGPSRSRLGRAPGCTRPRGAYRHTSTTACFRRCRPVREPRPGAAWAWRAGQLASGTRPRCSPDRCRLSAVGRNNMLMAEPPVVIFGPGTHSDSWWALLPTADVLRSPHFNDLLALVERAMAKQEPGRPFILTLDHRGTREPGAPGAPGRGLRATTAPSSTPVRYVYGLPSSRITSDRQ